MNFEEGAIDYLGYIEVTRSSGTYRYQKCKVDSLVKFFKHKKIDTIDKRDVISLISFLRKRNNSITNTTINKYISILKRILKYTTDLTLEFDALPENKKIVSTVTEDDIDKVFNHFQKHLNHSESLRNYALFKLILDTGLRISEALNLKVIDIDFTSSTIHVKLTKTKRERYVFFTRTTKMLLQRLISNGNLKHHIFINYKNKKPMSVDNVEKICYRLRRTLKLDYNINPHRWRHTFATNFLKLGGNLESLRLIMGHTSLKTTQIYLHLDKETLKNEYFRAFS